LEFKRALAHGTFNGAMRLAQGGKFHHGFLSGFVSSLGGSFLIKNGGDMTGIGKITISAAIGGTAEALGGGKFANGAVTGAYVMAFNHLMHTNTKGEGNGEGSNNKNSVPEKQEKPDLVLGYSVELTLTAHGEFGTPESQILTIIGGTSGIYVKINKVLSDDIYKKSVPTLFKHYPLPTLPVLKFVKYVPYIGWPADIGSIATSASNAYNFGWTTEYTLDFTFSVIGLYPGYGDGLSLLYLGVKEGNNAVQKIWDATRIGFNRIEQGIYTLPYW
jgi:hypothetical protein